MQIRSSDPSRSRSIEDLDEPSNTAPAGKTAVERPAPDWDRVPTLDTAKAMAVQSCDGDSKALMPKLERLQRDVKELHDALAPYARECKEVHHGLHEIEEAIDMIKHAKDFGPFASEIIGLAIGKAVHGVHAIVHGYAGMKREAPEAARKAEPALKKVFDDVSDLKASLRPEVERPVSVRG